MVIDEWMNARSMHCSDSDRSMASGDGQEIMGMGRNACMAGLSVDDDDDGTRRPYVCTRRFTGWLRQFGIGR